MAVGKIICIGDSLTRGDESNASGHRSYRGALQLLLQNAGYTVDFVGREVSVPATGGTDGEHEGYGGARMDSSDDALNSIEGRVSAMRTAAGPVDIIILYIGWNDVYNATGSIATKYSDLLTTIRSGDWASAKLVLATLHPEPNKSAAQTGSDYAEYALLNTQIRSEADANHVVADLATLATGADASAMIETLIYDAQNAPDYSTIQSGHGISAPLGGHMAPSFLSMQDYCAQWTTNVAVRYGPGGPGLVSPDPSTVGHPSFINNVQCVVPWLWVFAGPGNAATNTCIESRNMFAQAWRSSTGQWEFFFQGARTGTDDDQDVNIWTPPNSGGRHPLAASGNRGDGVTSWYRPYFNTGIEAWPRDTTPSRGIETFNGGRNRAAMADAVCFCWGVQVRLALVDPTGVNDIAQAVMVAKSGADFATGIYPYHYDYWGWPWNVCDGGSDRWKRITSTEWVWVGGISIGDHWADPGRPPPLYANWPASQQFNDLPTYAKTAAQVRANPPRLPSYVSGNTTGVTSAWTPSDYDYNPDISALDIHWSQQGADKAARVLRDVMVAAGWLDNFEGTGPVAPSLLPGIATTGAWTARFSSEATDPDTAEWSGAEPAPTPGLPEWVTTLIPRAEAGVPYSVQFSATGATSYSVVTGQPVWLTVGSDGAASGTPTDADVPNDPSTETSSIVIRATNVAGSVDRAFDLNVIGVVESGVEFWTPVDGTATEWVPV